MLKKLIYFFLNSFLFASVQSDITTIHVLKNRLNKIDNTHLLFTQQIKTSNDNIIEINKGELWIKQPNLFHCHIFDPIESFLISDGSTVWFYVPNIKQVTAYNLKTNIIDNIFLKLLFHDNILKWYKYDIIQKKDWFYLTPFHFNHTYSKKYQIKINDRGIIEQFNIIESHGQCISFYLFKQHITAIDMNKFQFIIDNKDIQLDDQRL